MPDVVGTYAVRFVETGPGEEDAYDAMQRLVERGRASAATVHRSCRFDDFAAAAEMDEVEAELREVFAQGVEDIGMILGAPRFVGDLGAPGFPDWTSAKRVAVWVTEDDRAAYLALTKDGALEPFELRVGLR